MINHLTSGYSFRYLFQIDQFSFTRKRKLGAARERWFALWSRSAKQPPHKILLVDDDAAVLDMVTQGLQRKGYEVVAVAGVNDALKRITTENFDALITDLHMPNPGDGFTVISAMRHSQPDALTLLVSGYPDVQSAMATIFLEADEIVTKPFEIRQLAQLLHDRMLNRKAATSSNKERVGAILQRCSAKIIEEWLGRAKQSIELNHLKLSDAERAGYVGKLVEDLSLRLGLSRTVIKDSDALCSPAAVAHGELRYLQGYSPTMLIHESRILQVTIFGTLQENLNTLDFSLGTNPAKRSEHRYLQEKNSWLANSGRGDPLEDFGSECRAGWLLRPRPVSKTKQE